MAANDCQFVRERMSAFRDGEVGGLESSRILAHVERCAVCAAELRAFKSLSAAFEATSPSEPPDLWPQIADQLSTSPQHVSVIECSSSWRSKSLRYAGILALTASLLMVVGMWIARHPTISGPSASSTGALDPGLLASQQPTGMTMSDDHMQEFVGVMNDYLTALPLNPEAAEAMLLERYEGKEVAPGDAATLVGYRPIIAGGLPEGYSLASTSVLKMPCCTCFKAVCRRSDGSTLVLFEHDDQETAWFGERPSSMAMCGDKDCCLVQLDSVIAATWTQGFRNVTAVGVKNQEEVTRLVNWLGREAKLDKSGNAATEG